MCVCVCTRLTFKEIIAKIIWLAELRTLIEKRLLFRILFSCYSAAYTKRWCSIVRKYEQLFCNMLPQKYVFAYTLKREIPIALKQVFSIPQHFRMLVLWSICDLIDVFLLNYFCFETQVKLPIMMKSFTKYGNAKDEFALTSPYFINMDIWWMMLLVNFVLHWNNETKKKIIDFHCKCK